MDNQTRESQIELLRAATEGTVSRRHLLRRGLRAGLGLGAVAGLLAVSGSGKASARKYEYTDCIIVIDYGCITACGTAQTACLGTQSRATCSAQYSSCKGACSYRTCFADNDAGEGVLT